MVTPDESAREILEVVPHIMHTIRRHMRSHSSPELSVPQFRTLAFLNRWPGASLSDVAENIGLTLPSMSKLVDGLVARQLVRREASPVDRRCITLALTSLGQRTFQAAYQATQVQLAELLTELNDAERTTVVAAMRALRPIFVVDREK